MTFVTPGQIVRYRFYDLMTRQYYGDIPLSSATASQRLVSPGEIRGDVILGDPRMTALHPLAATQPAKTLVVVDVNGTIVWGGMLWTRTFSRSQRTLSLQGNEPWSYLAHRVQAKDYSLPWATTRADALVIAQRIIEDALAVPGSAFADMAVVLDYAVANAPDNWITGSWPIEQLQTVDTIVGNLAGMGYGVGFDFFTTWEYVAGKPVPTLHLAYPRAGAVYDPATSNALSTAPAFDYTYPEDATTQANKVYITASLGSGTSGTAVDDPASLAAGYPLLEEVANYPQVNSGDQLSALASAELATHTNVPTAPTVDVDPFGAFKLGSFLTGDDIRWIIPRQVTVPPVSDERFPGGDVGEY